MDCVDIATVNDDIYEENEQLSVALSSTTLGVGIAQGTATVEITDNDGKTTLLYYSCILFKCVYLIRC